jgi:hypothetical protein
MFDQARSIALGCVGRGLAYYGLPSIETSANENFRIYPDKPDLKNLHLSGQISAKRHG